MTRIFFIGWFQNGQPDGHRGAIADFALNPHLATVQLHATFYEQKTQAGAGPASDVGATMKGGKQHSLIVLRNPDAPIADNAEGFIGIAFDRKTNTGSRLGVFHRVTQEVG